MTVEELERAVSELPPEELRRFREWFAEFEAKTEKTFDAVGMMRSSRDRISAQIEGMTLEEELEWLASQKLDDPFLERLRDRAAPRPSAASQASRGR